MSKQTKLFELVKNTYTESSLDFAHWVWENHVQVVATFAKEISLKYGGNPDLAVAGALLHDFGDAFVHRHSVDHEKVTLQEAVKILNKAGYIHKEIEEIIEKIIAPHSCKGGYLPTTNEGKILATADALAHLTTDFYLQFSWKHLPENKTYAEFLTWAQEKLERDFHIKIFFPEIKGKIRGKYNALKLIFS